MPPNPAIVSRSVIPPPELGKDPKPPRAGEFLIVRRPDGSIGPMEPPVRELPDPETTMGKFWRAARGKVLQFAVDPTEGLAPSIRFAVGLMRNDEDKLRLLQKAYPRAKITMNDGDFTAWTVHEVDAGDLRSLRRNFGPRVGGTHPDGRHFAYRPQPLNGLGPERGDFLAAAPEIAKALIALKAKTPTGAAGVDAITDALHSLAGAVVSHAATGETSLTVQDLIQDAAGAASWGGIGQGASQVATDVASRFRPRNALARRAAAQSLRGGDVPGDFNPLSTPGGMPIAVEGGNAGIARAGAGDALRSVGRGIENTAGAAFRAFSGQPNLTGGRAIGIPDLESLGPVAARRIQLAQQHQISLRPDEILESQLARDAAEGLRLSPSTKQMFAEFDAMREQQFDGAFRRLLSGVSTERGAEAIGNDVTKAFQRQIDELTRRLERDAGFSIGRASKELGDTKAFGFEHTVAVIDNALRKLEIAGTSGAKAAKSSLLSIRRQMVREVPAVQPTPARRQAGFTGSTEPGTPGRKASEQVRKVNAEQFLSVLQQYGQSTRRRAVREILGETESTLAQTTVKQLYAGITRDLSAAAGVAAASGKGTAFKELVKARQSYRSIITDRRELRKGILGHVLRKASKGRELPAGESVVDVALNLQPSEVREFLGALKGIDPEVERAMRGGMIERIFEKAQPSAARAAGESPLNFTKLIQATDQQGKRLLTLMGGSRVAALKDLTTLARIIQRRNVGGSQTAMRLNIEGVFDSVASLFAGRWARAASEGGVAITKQGMAQLFTNPDWRRGLLRALDVPKHRPRAVRAAARTIKALVAIDAAEQEDMPDAVDENNEKQILPTSDLFDMLQ